MESSLASRFPVVDSPLASLHEASLHEASLPKAFRLLAALVLVQLVMAAAGPAMAAAKSVVTFGADMGIVFIDSRSSRAAFDLFESLNVPVQSRFLSQVKVLVSPDGAFRIACQARSADYACAVIVYPGAHAALDFETDQVSLDLPRDMAAAYKGVFAKGNHFELATEDGQFRLSWQPERLSIIAPGHPPRATPALPRSLPAAP